MYLQDVLKTSSRRLQDVLEDNKIVMLKTSSRHLQGIHIFFYQTINKTRIYSIFQTSLFFSSMLFNVSIVTTLIASIFLT